MSDRARMVTFFGAAVLLLALALLLGDEGIGPARRQPALSPSGAVVERAPRPTSASRQLGTVEAAAGAAGSARQTAYRERESKLAPAVAPSDRVAAATAARAFLGAYLPYSYGRGELDRIRSAAAPLVRALRAAPPRVPSPVARARPRLVSALAQAAVGERDVPVVAAVDDGRRRYDVRLTVHRGAGRWAVTEISG